MSDSETPYYDLYAGGSKVGFIQRGSDGHVLLSLIAGVGGITFSSTVDFSPQEALQIAKAFRSIEVEDELKIEDEFPKGWREISNAAEEAIKRDTERSSSVPNVDDFMQAFETEVLPIIRMVRTGFNQLLSSVEKKR